MNSETDNGKFIICSKCNAQNNAGDYECVNCKEVLSYDEAGEPVPDVAEKPLENESCLAGRFFSRRCIYYIPPFIILLCMLTAYLYYDRQILLEITMILFLPWLFFCVVDIYNTENRKNNKEEAEKKDTPPEGRA